MYINLYESISEKKNDIIERIVLDRLEKYCSYRLDHEFEDILLNPKNKKFKKIILDILHSYNLGDDNKIYDVSHNLIMDYEDYKKIFNPLELSFLTYDDYINSKECDDYKNYKTNQILVYNIACKKAKQINIRKLKKELL